MFQLHGQYLLCTQPCGTAPGGEREPKTTLLYQPKNASAPRAFTTAEERKRAFLSTVVISAALYFSVFYYTLFKGNIPCYLAY